MSANDPNHVAYVRGHKLFKRGRFAPAAKWFSVAIEEWPEDWPSSMGTLGALPVIQERGT